jgi:hypothetical protein
MINKTRGSLGNEGEAKSNSYNMIHSIKSPGSIKVEIVSTKKINYVSLYTCHHIHK